jgi:hypothetical protein
MAVRAYAPSTPFAVTDGSQLWGCGTAEAVPGYMVRLSQNRGCKRHLLIRAGAECYRYQRLGNQIFR